ncbi:MAG: protein phosphatase 2C domain-containing protein [Myxococcota bacterium]|nr:protein phosphatase 2C domain-containing protein [Myxococcota bacterium]
MTTGALEEAKLYLDCAMEEVEEQGLAGGLAAVHSSRAPGKSAPNEDAAALIPVAPDCAVLAVADGLGGARSGHEAAALAVGCLADAVARHQGDEEPLRAAILDAFEVANEAVLALGVGAATTLSVVELREGVMRPYHAGDSGILVVGQRGRVKLQTLSHSPVGFGVASGLIDEAEALHHEDRHVVSNVIGNADMRIEMGSELPLAQRDTVLLASDGLLDNLHGEEIIEIVRKGPLGAAARRLVGDAGRRMREPVEGEPSKPDDLTLVAWRAGGT